MGQSTFDCDGDDDFDCAASHSPDRVDFVPETSRLIFHQSNRMSSNGQNEEPTKPPTPVPVTVVVAPAVPGTAAVPLPVKEVPKTVHEAAYKWLAEQGVSTVLLFLIVMMLAVGVPRYMIPAIQGGYERNAATYKEVLTIQIESRERWVKTIMEGHDRDREAFRDAMRDRRP